MNTDKAEILARQEAEKLKLSEAISGERDPAPVDSVNDADNDADDEDDLEADIDENNDEEED